MNMSSLVKSGMKAVKQNSPELLTGLGMAGVLVTGYLTAKASFKAARLLRDDEYYNTRYPEPRPEMGEKELLSTKEQAELVWRFYIPPIVTGLVTVGCILGASRSGNRRTAAAVTAYSLGEKAFAEYREKVVEQIGKGKEQKIRDEVVQDRVNGLTPSNVIITGSGDVMCCELFTGRYFRSEMEKLRRCQNDVNMMVVNERYVTLDEFYDLVGLPHTSQSDILGWDSSKLMELNFSTVLGEKGEPCLAFDYNYTKPL